MNVKVVWFNLELGLKFDLNTSLAVELLHHSGYFRVVTVEGSGMEQLSSLPFDAV